MSVYAVKDEGGDLRDSGGDTPDSYSHFNAWTGIDGAETFRRDWYPDGHVVELAEKAEPVEVPQWFDEWLGAFSKAGPKRGPLLAAGRIAQEGMNITADEPFLGNSVIDPTDTPRLTREQSGYLYYHKQELMLAVLAGNYTVNKPQRWYVKVPDNWGNVWEDDEVPGWFFKNDTGHLRITDEGNREGSTAEQFTAEEIDKYHLGGFETVEVES